VVQQININNFIHLTICSNETECDYEFMFTMLKNSAKQLFDYDYRPSILIVDAAPAIHNGFMKAFEYNSIYEFKRVI
jgi:hypothetical protein